ncbi:MAG: polyphenol oxidase family protein [Elusimicrobia bacterium]|nr:polyphenol oxidase family protein [Elusimicrobiota bacterium]
MWKLKHGFYYEDKLKRQGIVNFTTTVFHGNMKYKKNREKVLKYFGIKNFVSGIQTHSDNIKIVSKKDIFKINHAIDGFITDKKGIPLAVFTADCLPVFIHDRVKKIVGLVHAGRAGLEKNIIKKAIDIFMRSFGSKPLDIFIAVGPHIKKCCYGVDLDKVISAQAHSMDVKKISLADICTHNNNFFSYRRNKTKERMLSLIMMR